MTGSLETSTLQPKRRINIFGVRHGQIALLCAAMISSYLIRLNLSDGVVAMTKPMADQHYPTLNWSNAEKGSLLGMFFYGYIIGTLPGGFIVTKLTPKVAMSVSGILTGILNMAFPYIAIECGYHASCLSRVVMGVLQGVFVPGVSLHISRWAAPKERGQFTSFVHSGNSFGSFLMLCSGGYLGESRLGWPSMFYLSGACILLWGIAWFFMSVESPSVHRSITLEERIYIEGAMHDSRSHIKKSQPVPWLQICTSKPLWALIFGAFSFNWGYWTLETMLPTYMEGVLNFNLSENGLLSSLPSLGMACGALVFPFFDKLISWRFELSVGFHRKSWNSVALYSNTILFGVLALIRPEAGTVVTILVISTTLSAGEYGGAGSNVIDLTDNFAGVASGVANGFSNTASLLAPMVAGFVINDTSDVSEWRIVFLIGAILFLVGNTLFLMFSSFEVQPWNDPNPLPSAQTHVSVEAAPSTDEPDITKF